MEHESPDERRSHRALGQPAHEGGKVHEGGRKWVRPRVDLSDSSELKGTEQHHMKFSKITFYWDTNKKQRRKWSYTGANVSYEDDAPEIFLDSLRKLSTATVVRYN